MSLVEGVDYYKENGKYVFTADFLRRRGYCCKNGCRHCPYGFRKKPSATWSYPMFEINYGIVLLRIGDPPLLENALHFVGYPEPPDDGDFRILWEELSTDDEFGWVGRLDGLELVEAPPDVVQYFREQIGPVEDN